MCQWCSFHILTPSVIYYWTDAQQHGIYLSYVIKKQTTTAFFNWISALIKSYLCQLWQTRKKPFDIICCLYKMQQSHWLLCVAKSCYWSTKMMTLSNLTWTASHEMKIYSERRIELWRKCRKNQCSFCHQSSPVNGKAWMMPWILLVVEIICWKNLQLQSTLKAIL